MAKPQPTAAFVIIGNEILSGRTRDSNLHFLAALLTEIGIRLLEVRVVADIEPDIVAAVNELRPRFDYVFTSGGIGPTHDDITSAAIAKAVGVPLERHPEAWKLLQAHYSEKDSFNEARQKMAYTPRGASLVENVISAAPGFKIKNVYVLAGVPMIFQAMLQSLRHVLKGGRPMISLTVNTSLTEGTIAEPLSAIQRDYLDVEIGSYPHIRKGKLGTSLVARGQNEKRVKEAQQKILSLVNAKKGEVYDKM